MRPPRDYDNRCGFFIGPGTVPILLRYLRVSIAESYERGCRCACLEAGSEHDSSSALSLLSLLISLNFALLCACEQHMVSLGITYL